MSLRPALFLLLLSAGPAFGQSTTTHRLLWTTPAKGEQVKQESPTEAPSRTTRRAEDTPAPVTFERALLATERQDLPYFHRNVALPTGTREFRVAISNATYAPMSDADVKALPGLKGMGPEPLIEQHLSWYRKQPTALVSIFPYRKVGFGNTYERLVSFDLDVVATKGGGALGSYKAYPSTSKLGTGSWYRFSVPDDGVYALTYSDLVSLGVEVNGLSSSSINIYGNHIGMLPFQNSEVRPTDLELNACLVEDGGDGQFDQGDRILFYASGPQRWEEDGTCGLFRHVKNVYSDSAGYFLGINVDPPKRITDVALATDPPTTTITTFNDRQFIERDLSNLLKSGREFYGETYDLVLSYNYNFSVPFLRSDEPVNLRMDVATRTIGTGNASTWNVSVAGGVFSTSFAVTGFTNNYAGLYAKPTNQCFSFNSAQTNLPITVSFTKSDPVSSVGWMNFLEVNCVRDLKFSGDQLGFRHVPSVGPGQIGEFQMDLAQNVARIWEVTDPMNVGNIPFTVSGNSKTFRLATDSLRQFIAFRNTNYKVPTLIGPVPNQNLHAIQPPVDLMIVTHPLFLTEAQQLADRRASEGLSVQVVLAQQVYNEFSSGQRDATAIKRFMKMLYDRAGNDPELIPRYLLLFGDGSYNNINWSANNQGYLPSYQTANSTNVSASYVSDDYFGLLDDGEGEYTGDLVDIGIGRLPVHTKEQAREVLSKILNYDRLNLLSSGGQVCSADGSGGASDWRTQVLFASDDQEGDNFEGSIHMSQSDALATTVENEHADLNVAKIYLDAYQQYSTPGGERYPDASSELKERVQKGCLIVNYVGHGGEVGWAHERFLDNSTILGWSNFDRLPLFMTATCEFSRWDDPGRTSAGEYVLVNPNGGGIGLMTTTRIAYSTQNFTLSQFFYDHVFEETQEQGEAMRLGDIFRRTKFDITSNQPNQVNHRNFALLGDPTVRLAMPRQSAVITAVEDTLGNPLDTLKALSTVRIRGIVTDGMGQQLNDFNGLVIPTVYDKRVTQSTLANDGGVPFNFGIRKNIIYRGKASVTNGAFDFTFVVPKDIAYQFGTGRVSVYAESNTTNAYGHSNDPIVGGTATDAALDEEGPQVQLFLNDERFVRGGITNETPLLFAKLFDENGINTLGNSIGHDLIAILDANTERAIVLNDLYEADLDTYKSGQVRYRFSELSEGNHTLSLKAWDVHNNSSEAYTEFVVAPSEELALEHVLNYPNPFTTYTEFYFEHNRPCSSLEVQVQVFTVSGRLVKTLNAMMTCEGFRGEPLAWNGLDDHGDKLARGVYVYRLGVRTPEGDKAEKFEKLVILR